MKKRRVLRMASAPALLLSLGVVAACEEPAVEPVVEEPTVQEEPAEPQTPGQTSPSQSPTMQEPAEEADDDLEPLEEPGETEQER